MADALTREKIADAMMMLGETKDVLERAMAGLDQPPEAQAVELEGEELHVFFAREFAQLCQRCNLAAAYVSMEDAPLIVTANRPSGSQVRIGGHRDVAQTVSAVFAHANGAGPMRSTLSKPS